MEHTLNNENTRVSYDDVNKEFSLSDKTDQYNLPCAFNQTKRSHKKAWKKLTEMFNHSLTMYGCCNILRESGIRMHTYCSMD